MTEFMPTWLSLVIAALFLILAVRAKSTFDRVTGACFGGVFISAAVASRMTEPRIAFVVESVFLGVWGLLVARPWLTRMPTSLARSGVALCVAATAMGFVPGIWKLMAVVAMAILFLVCLWLVDSLEAKGVIVAGKQRAADETRSRTTRS
jgi:hypothetical protein